MSRGSRKRDYYEVLGVPRDAEPAELKRAFREMARKFHPDINPGDADAEDTFKEANEAYAVLSDPKARARYDRYGFAGVDTAAGQTGFGSVIDAFDDIIGDILRRRRQRKRGRDLRYTLELDFEEAAFGTTKTIRIPDPRDTSDGPRREREFTVSIPAGAKDGAVKMLKGEGEPGRGGASPGDLHVIVRVRAHSVFSREGHDVWCEVPITFPQAALGAVVEVPTLDGKVKMRIPEGTQSGRVFRIRNRGVPRSANASALRGDQMVRVLVETPTNLTSTQRSLLEQLAKETGDPITHPQRKGFLDKLRDLFQE